MNKQGILKRLKFPKWRVGYLECCGVMSIYEDEEFYYALSRFGAWLAFMDEHNWKPKSGYQSNWSYGVMKEDITKI